MRERVVRLDEEWGTRALAAGFVAVGVMTLVFVLGYVVAIAIGTRDGTQLATWFAGLASNQLTQAAGGRLLVFVAIHFAFGLAWSLVYAALFAHRLPGSGWERGMLFSLLPWALSLLVFFPITGAGFFGLDLGAGPLPILGNLILHLAYGATLGQLYALPIATAADSGEQQRAMLGAEHGIILGLLAGAVIGSGLGALASLAIPGTSLMAGLVAGGSSGAALGVIAGSLAGLSRATLPPADEQTTAP